MIPVVRYTAVYRTGDPGGGYPGDGPHGRLPAPLAQEGNHVYPDRTVKPSRVADGMASCGSTPVTWAHWEPCTRGPRVVGRVRSETPSATWDARSPARRVRRGSNRREPGDRWRTSKPGCLHCYTSRSPGSHPLGPVTRQNPLVTKGIVSLATGELLRRQLILSGNGDCREHPQPHVTGRLVRLGEQD